MLEEQLEEEINLGEDHDLIGCDDLFAEFPC
jgi:hypothetical protein